MHLQYPNILWWLFALLVPIAVHFFNFRKNKTVYFSNTSVLKTIQQTNVKKKKLKYLVTLALRCLFVIAAVLAFARPYVGNGQSNLEDADNIVGVYVDNSLSMSAESQERTLFLDARNKAADLVKGLNPSTRYILLSNSFELENEFPMSQEEMLLRLEQMESEAPPVDMGIVIDRFQMLIQQHGCGRSTLFLLSDFQKATFDISKATADTMMQLVAMPQRASVNDNISVDTVWLETPILQIGMPNALHVLLRNYGAADKEGVGVNFEIDGHPAAFASADIEAGGEAHVTLPFVIDDGGVCRGRVSVYDYPITFDDSYYLALNIGDVVKVAAVGDVVDNKALSCLYDDALFEYLYYDVKAVDLSSLLDNQFIILDGVTGINETMQQSLLDFAKEGGSLAVFPSRHAPISCEYLYRELGLLLSSEVDTNATAFDEIVRGHAFFDDVFDKVPDNADLPTVYRYYHIKSLGKYPVYTLASMRNGSPFLLQVPWGNGVIFVFASPLDSQYNDLISNPFFVPLMLKMAFEGSKVRNMSFVMGDDSDIMINIPMIRQESPVVMRDEQGLYETKPMMLCDNNRSMIKLTEAVPKSGFYELSQDGVSQYLMAWNDSRRESVMDYATQKEIRENFKQAGWQLMALLDSEEVTAEHVLDSMTKRYTLSVLLMILALVALVGEALVLRFWK